MCKYSDIYDIDSISQSRSIESVFLRVTFYSFVLKLTVE